jgi:hypothetical protein
LVDEPDDDELSIREIKLLDEIFHKYGHWDRFELAKYTHTLPEYTETTSSIPIAYQEILKGANISGDTIATIMHDLAASATFEKIVQE